MKTVFVEATSKQGNWGKFMIGVFDQAELERRSSVDQQSIVWGRGWRQGHVLVVDLQTGEGGIFKMGGLASADLDKHQIWVCPLFEPFLAWLYLQPDPMQVPPTVELDAPLAFAGYRRTGPAAAVRELATDLLASYQTCASAADSYVPPELEARAEALGIEPERPIVFHHNAASVAPANRLIFPDGKDMVPISGETITLVPSGDGWKATERSRPCQKCGELFKEGPTALDRERYARGVCGGCP